MRRKNDWLKPSFDGQRPMSRNALASGSDRPKPDASAFRLICGLMLAVFLLVPVAIFAQETAPPNKPNLANDQDAIKARYKRFNLTLQQMAEILRKQDPERADLLFRALGKSQETRVVDQLHLIFDAQIGRAHV